MNLEYLKKFLLSPALYEPGDAAMWTDEYISKELLKIHLNPELDLATRKPESIGKTMEFIIKHCHTLHMNILDLGCGPGIYTEKFSLLGHRVTGVDISRNSIEYAKDQSLKKQLNIKYIHRNYLDLEFDSQFDMVIFIYTDFGVLVPEERQKMLEIIYHSLKPGGVFIFDVINDKNLEQKSSEYRNWRFEEKGFWRNVPYLELNVGLYYPEQKVLLNQHTIIEERGKHATYRFWIHIYDTETLKSLLLEPGFELLETSENVLPEGDIWNGSNVTFLVFRKPA